MSQWIVEGPENGPLFVFAHGAGAGMEHDFMTAVAKGLVEQGIRVVRFNFPYMVKRSEDGKKRPPDRTPKLLEAYSEVIAHFASSPVVIGGKSMGENGEFTRRARAGGGHCLFRLSISPSG